MEAAHQEIVDSAIENGSDAIAFIEFDSHTLSFSAKFLGRDAGGFRFETSFLPPNVTPEAIAAGVTTTFRFGISGAAIEFQANMLSLEKSTSPAIVRCGAPGEFIIRQRRAHFRAPVRTDPPLEMVVWKIPPHWILRDKPKPSMLLKVELVDLSVGGMCLNILKHRLGPEAIAVGDRLRAEISFKDEHAMFDMTVIYRAGLKSDGSMRVGISFRKVENSLESRKGTHLMNQAIAAVQRQNIRFGAMSA
jgi:c-di-GMP-binding flagellar brake protein YcgR